MYLLAHRFVFCKADPIVGVIDNIDRVIGYNTSKSPIICKTAMHVREPRLAKEMA